MRPQSLIEQQTLAVASASKVSGWSGRMYIPPLDYSLFHYPAITADAKISMVLVDEVAAFGERTFLLGKLIPSVSRGSFKRSRLDDAFDNPEQQPATPKQQEHLS